MNKIELANAVSMKTGLSKNKSRAVINAFISSITEAMGNGEEVVISGFCIFEIREMAEREVRNPRNGKRILIPAKQVVRFTPSRKLSQAAVMSTRTQSTES
ncbi:MAG: HU family DNA-binding protein [Magnetococcales bacterium]|nr:HU family DNA-binding protein [Magnetococcales bacterium]